jgi:hypothetical protein
MIGSGLVISHFRLFYHLRGGGNGLLNASFRSSLTIEHPSGEACVKMIVERRRTRCNIFESRFYPS